MQIISIPEAIVEDYVEEMSLSVMHLTYCYQ